MSTMREAQQAWDNAQPHDTSHQERDHELACEVAFEHYLKTGDLPGGEDASHVWDELEDNNESGLVLFDMLEAHRDGDDTLLLILAKIVAGRVDNIVNGMIEDAV